MLTKEELSQSELTIRLTIRSTKERSTLTIECGASDGSESPPDLLYRGPTLEMPIREARIFLKSLQERREQNEGRRASVQVFDLSEILSSVVDGVGKAEVRN